MLSAEQRSLRARVAAYSRWSQEDPRSGTAPARKTFLSRFALAVDPEGVLPPEERARRAECALKAHMGRLALASARARRKASG